MANRPAFHLLKNKKISEVINPRLIQGAPDLSINAALELMQKEQSAYIVVAEKGKVVGMFTETDVVRNIMDQDVDWKRPIRDFMTINPQVLRPEDSVGAAIDLMAQFGFYHIPLVDTKNNLTGVLSVRTLVRFLAEFYPSEVFNLPPNPHQVMPTAEGG